MCSPFTVIYCFSTLLYLASFTLALSPPQLNTSNTNIELNVRPGIATTIECPVKIGKNIIFEWYKDNEYIMAYEGPRLRILTNGSLKIKETNFDDTGVYRCRAVNGFGSVEFNTTLLVIGDDEDYEPYGRAYYTKDSDAYESKISLTAEPRFLYLTKGESPTYRKTGTTFKLQCVAIGYPKPQIMWYKDGNQVARVFRIGRWALKFTKALTTDSGNYTCVAKNVLGKVSHSWLLIVDEKELSFKDTPNLSEENTTVPEGKRAIIQCGVKSDAFPHMEWLKQVDPNNRDPNDSGMAIPMDGEYFTVLSKPYKVDYTIERGLHNHRLIIDNVRLRDAGKYVCLGANSFGYEYRFTYLEVIPKNIVFQNSVPFPIVVTVIVIGIAAFACVFALLRYCRPRHRTGSRGSSTGETMVTKEDFIPMQSMMSRDSSMPSRSSSKHRCGKTHHKVGYVSGQTI